MRRMRDLSPPLARGGASGREKRRSRLRHRDGYRLIRCDASFATAERERDGYRLIRCLCLACRQRLQPAPPPPTRPRERSAPHFAASHACTVAMVTSYLHTSGSMTDRSKGDATAFLSHKNVTVALRSPKPSQTVPSE